MKNTSFRSASIIAARRLSSVSACLAACGLLALASSAATAAELYKCAGDGGVPTYQNMPCAKGKELRNMSSEDTLSV
ncbi:MAG: DUF4124 domain-containing protein, partial [Burkholderiales bacterium]|nr:DUF4124 domain-containing protein [Burkholderiales bacterium]